MPWSSGGYLSEGERDNGAALKKAIEGVISDVAFRLYNDWSTLVKFQRTRGVLRLMAASSTRFGKRATGRPSFCHLPSRSTISACNSNGNGGSGSSLLEAVGNLVEYAFIMA
jgi:hypothetical protein